MYPYQDCTWVVSPINANKSTTTVLELLKIDMAGGALTVYDGSSSDTAPVLLNCNGCALPGLLLIARSGSILLRFTSVANPAGTGFLGVYWTWTLSDYNQTAGGQVLEIPPGLAMDESIASNISLAWDLRTSTTTPSTLKFSTTLLSTSSDDITKQTFDGRPVTASRFSSIQATSSSCGILSAPDKTYLSEGTQLQLSMSQLSNGYLRSSVGKKVIIDVVMGDPKVNEISIDIPFIPARVCKYRVQSGSTHSLRINVTAFNGTQDGHLLILGGITGVDAVLLSTNASDIANQDYIAPCGSSTIVLASKSVSNPSYSLMLSYSINPLDDGSVCSRYKDSLHPSPRSTVPWLVIIVSVSVGGGILVIIISVLCLFRGKEDSFLHRHLLKLRFRNIKVSQFKQIVAHPRYTPAVDNIKNQFLPISVCCICSAEKKTLKLGCEHSLCLECVHGNLEAALNDIGMFPVRCPMHFDGCESLLDAHIAKRVLKEAQYKRFLDFQDRAMYGEGMRCIFCDHYVNLPLDTTISIVTCPHCMQRFCIRCKQAYNVYHKCPLAHVDDSLEQWKKQSGAQKCPSCLKLIEKDGEETCNHMVHKLTDAIPCIRERTDFCYICGAEVSFHFT